MKVYVLKIFFILCYSYLYNQERKWLFFIHYVPQPLVNVTAKRNGRVTGAESFMSEEE